jgi:hypothetical protein
MNLDLKENQEKVSLERIGNCKQTRLFSDFL